MADLTLGGGPVHPAVEMHLADLRRGRIGRREFLTRATALGLTAAGAATLAGGPAAAQEPPARLPVGGTLRIQTNVMAMKEPRAYDWSQVGNQSRGILEYLVEYTLDGSFRPMLLEGWELNEDATRYTLHVRRGITWHDGTDFTAADVVRNIELWCDGTAEANSMASRLTALMEGDRLREGAVEMPDPYTVVLNLSRPDIAIIANVSDYPAAIAHVDHDHTKPYETWIGTGPYTGVSLEVGVRCVMQRSERRWWGTDIYGGPYLDRIELIDYGTDPAQWVAAAEAGEVDLLYETVGTFVEVFDSLGWTRTETPTASTLAIRPNQAAEVNGKVPYADVRVRRALQLAVSNEICLELGYSNRGEVAANHHVCPVHPAYADIGPAEFDPATARARMVAAGLADFQHELVTVDDDFERNTGAAVVAMLNDAGIPATHRIVPGATFWSGWLDYPFSATAWNHRPLDVQVLAIAYRSGEPWNESAYANPAFDALLDRALGIADADTRREIMAEIEQTLRDDGVVIQPYWRTLFNHHDGTVVGAEKHPSNEFHYYKFAIVG